MRTADAEAAEALAELEDRRRHRLTAWLRRRHRGRRPARLDRWPEETLVDATLGRVLRRLTERVRDTDQEAQASRDRLAHLRSIEAQTARGR